MGDGRAEGMASFPPRTLGASRDEPDAVAPVQVGVTALKGARSVKA
jgi:hypothetical protein